jgi:hypothetical protein
MAIRDSVLLNATAVVFEERSSRERFFILAQELVEKILTP